jgi:pantoate--beta-alanine ligase
VREPDGLALSSRNAYLTPAERSAARTLSRALDAGHRVFAGGDRNAEAVVAAARGVAAGCRELRVEYIEAVDAEDLAPVESVTGDSLLAMAGWIGRTRLIDNVVLGKGVAGDERLAAPAG